MAANTTASKKNKARRLQQYVRDSILTLFQEELTPADVSSNPMPCYSNVGCPNSIFPGLPNLMRQVGTEKNKNDRLTYNPDHDVDDRIRIIGCVRDTSGDRV